MSLVRILGAVLIGAVCAALVGGLVVLAGPKTEVICGSGDALDRRYQDVVPGHIDGATASYCSAPHAGTWVVAGLAMIAVLFGVPR